MSAANDINGEYQAIGDDWLWSSTQEDEFCAWFVGMYSGGTNNSSKYGSSYVRAVSAFQYKY